MSGGSVVSYRNSTSNHNPGSNINNPLGVVSYRNSTSNHNPGRNINNPLGLYLIEILHQTTTRVRTIILVDRCILSKFYIKPQQESEAWQRFYVVSYRNSTSNHNIQLQRHPKTMVVSYRNSTSNHNAVAYEPCFNELYLIEILHQTTTNSIVRFLRFRLYLIEILHQTTTVVDYLFTEWLLYLIEILHQTTTATPHCNTSEQLYLIEILHQTTTILRSARETFCCILSKFYIKPQLSQWSVFRYCGCILSKFYIKPQRCPSLGDRRNCCILSKFYIKPQQYYNLFRSPDGCILSKFYIKPQHKNRISFDLVVVSYRNSTSNHNFVGSVRIFVVLYLIEILHQTTTEPEQKLSGVRLYLIEILHQTTTIRATCQIGKTLYLIEILHQTTTSGLILIDKVLLTGCLPL